MGNPLNYNGARDKLERDIEYIDNMKLPKVDEHEITYCPTCGNRTGMIKKQPNDSECHGPLMTGGFIEEAKDVFYHKTGLKIPNIDNGGLTSIHTDK